MSGIEILKKNELDDVEALAETLQQSTFDLKLPNGANLIKHEEQAYSNHYNNGKSFDDLVTKQSNGDADGIHFAFDFKLHPKGVEKMNAIGNTITSNTMILQHNCVMYSYTYSVTVVADQEDHGLLCEFRLIPINFTYRHPIGLNKGGVAPTMSQDPPEIVDAKLKIMAIDTSFDLERGPDGSYKTTNLFSLNSLKDIVKDGVTTFRVEMTIDEDYFDIGDYLDMQPKQPKPPKNSEKIVEMILKGDKPPMSDWVISVVDGSPKDFHCHGPVLMDSSVILRAAMVKHMSIGNADILSMISNENRFILPKLKADDMKVIITYAYQRRFLLPSFDAVSRIGVVLSHFFRDQVPEFFNVWQAELIKNMMGLDRGKGAATVCECVKTLVMVHSAPCGGLLGAYNVALIVAADAWQIDESKKETKKEGRMEKKVKKMVGKEWPLIDEILELIKDYQDTVCGVEKWKLVEQLA